MELLTFILFIYSILGATLGIVIVCMFGYPVNKKQGIVCFFLTGPICWCIIGIVLIIEQFYKFYKFLGK